MPHFILDCSDNILQKKSAQEIMQVIYDTASSTNLFAKGDIKVRINPYQYFNLGNNTAFIHVFANIMEGRTVDQKRNLSNRIVAQLKMLFPEVPIISMNIREFEKETYCNREMV